MTVIIGVNVTDRSLLAGDTRVSYEENGSVYIKHDNLQKVETLGGVPSITVACAGNAHLAKYLILELRKNIQNISGISEFQENAREIIGPKIHEYFTRYGFEEAYCTMIFAGSDTAIKKKINGEKFIEIANAATGGAGPIFVHSAIQAVFPPGQKVEPSEREISLNNTSLFAAEITPNNLEVTPCGWGEFLIYGPEGLVKSDIEPDAIAKFELDPHMKNNGSGVGNEIALLTAFIESQARKYNLSSVGESVLIYENNHSGDSKPLSGTIMSTDSSNIDPNGPRFQTPKVKVVSSIDAVSENKIYRAVSGTRYRLTPISRYDVKALEKMLL